MFKTTKAFKQAYASLNPEQKKAVNSLDGPVMVVAGPGTGKTQTVALRIANILLKTDTEPDAILALTFTESAAREMRERLSEFIGLTAYYVTISTFHSFCTDIIKENPELFLINFESSEGDTMISLEPMSELEKLKIINNILDDNKFKYLKPVNSPHHYTRSIIKAIQDLKREAINPKKFKAVLLKEQESLKSADPNDYTLREFSNRNRDLQKNKELLTIYRQFEKYLRSSRRFDFEDMINFVTQAFTTDKNLLRQYQELYHYFLIDEYQDTNSAQNKVVDLLGSYWGKQANVFVVGDPDQAIYRFQGASIENMLAFVKKYPQAKVITLKENYRSTQNILDAAHDLISHNHLRIDDVVEGLDSHLTSSLKTKNKKISIANLTSQSAESLYIKEEIKKLIKSGTKPSAIAIIYRNNSDAIELSNTLAKFNIDYTTQGGGNILEDPTVQRLLKIIRVIKDIRIKKEDTNLFTILHYDIFNIDPLDVLKISRRAANSRSTLFDVISNIKLLDDLNLKTKSNIMKVLNQLGEWQKIDANTTFTKFFETVLNESGFLDWVLNQPDAHHKISRINTLFTEIKKMNRFNHHLNLVEFLSDLDMMQANNLKIQEPKFALRDDAVVLTTAHSAKGLEWEHVFIYKVFDRLWGNTRTRQLIKLPASLLTNTDLSKKEKNEDERRLFYVALTRAKYSAIITHANTYDAYGRSKEVISSMFIHELPSNLLTKASVASTEDELAHHLEGVLRNEPNQSETIKKDEKAFLKNIVNNFNLSVTALNTYLECPYKFKLNNLLKVPRAKESYLAFGTAIHTALERFYNKFKTDSLRPKKEYLIKSFEKAIDSEILTTIELNDRKNQGQKILSSYYDFFINDFQEGLFLERFSRVMLSDITLTGKIDKIDWLDQSDRTIRVIDFKTGKAKTRGQIEGTTQDSQGNLKRQLVFYKLLIDLDRRLKVTFGEAELDFIESPEKKGKSGKQIFKISKDDVQELKKIIRSVMSEVRALKFPRTTHYTNCIRCEFKDHCWPNGIPTQRSNS